MDSKKEDRLLRERVGLNLYHLLEKSGLTQEELAEKMEVSPRTVSYWLSGIKEPSFARMIRLRGIFGVTLDDLAA
jgi:transcriptional regulator with XRE-family HTH domain